MSDQAGFKPPKVQLNIPLLTSVPVLVVGGVIAAFIFFWFFCRIEPTVFSSAYALILSEERLKED